MSKNFVRRNSIFGFISQIIILICGLILPRLILKEYGSNANGLVNSITSFLDMIALLEFGVGTAAQAALYKPLCEQDENRVSKIYNSIKRFYKIIGLIFVFYVVILSISLALVNIDEFSFIYTFTLVISMSISFFAQYYFGLANSNLISADQKVYITYAANMLTVILNTIISYFLIKYNFSIQILKLSTSIIFLLKPFLYTLYVKKNYKITNIKPDGTEIPEKWNALVQHINAYVLLNVDIIVLTIFSSLSNISIYSIYYLVLKSINNLIKSFTGGFQSYYGHLYANNEYNKFQSAVKKYFLITTSISIFVFSVSIIMIIPFIKIYTEGINDTNYVQPVFSILLIFAQLMYIFRYSLYQVISALGLYKDTQKSSIIETLINISISVLLVNFLGLIGVAIGTIAAMLYRTIHLSIFISKRIVKKSYIYVLKQLFIAIIMTILCYLYFKNININAVNYFEWGIKSAFVSVQVAIIFVLIFSVFNLDVLKLIFNSLKNKLKT